MIILKRAAGTYLGWRVDAPAEPGIALIFYGGVEIAKDVITQILGGEPTRNGENDHRIGCSGEGIVRCMN
jgi:hypothetical protein